MTELKMKCPECLHEFEGATNNLTTVCPNCAKEINTNQAVKYYQSLKKIENENQKIAEGEKYAKLNTLLDECKWLIDNGEFESALITTDMALELSTTDSRVYLMRVYAKTKNAIWKFPQRNTTCISICSRTYAVRTCPRKPLSCRSWKIARLVRFPKMQDFYVFR